MSNSIDYSDNVQEFIMRDDKAKFTDAMMVKI